MRDLAFAFAALALAVFVACGSPAGEAGNSQLRATPIGDVRHISVSARASVEVVGTELANPIKTVITVPSDIRLRPGQVQRITARALGHSGETMEGVQFEWVLLDRLAGAIKVVNDSTVDFIAGGFVGEFERAITVVGTQSETSADDRVTQHLSVIVVPPETDTLSSVEPIGGDIQAVSGQLLRLQGVALDILGRISPRALLRWELSDPELGTIVGNQFLEASGAPGNYADALTLTATLGEKTVSTSVGLNISESSRLLNRVQLFLVPRTAIIRAGGNFRFEAVATDGLGNNLRLDNLAWAVVDPRAGAIDQTGDFSAAMTEGAFRDTITVSAEIEGQELTARASVSVRSESSTLLANAAVRPVEIVVAAGQNSLFTAVAQDRFGRTVPDLDLRWELSDSSLGTITENGFFSATGAPGVYPGAIRLIATQALPTGQKVIEATADLSIVGALTKVKISPRQFRISANGAIALNALAFDENGTRIPGIIFEWRVLDPNAGTVSQSGVFRAGDIGGSYSDVIEVTAIQTAVD